MTAGPDCLEKRCAERNYQPGFGRWSLIAASRLPRGYHLTFDSEQMTTQECATTVAASWGIDHAIAGASEPAPTCQITIRE